MSKIENFDRSPTHQKRVWWGTRVERYSSEWQIYAKLWWITLVEIGNEWNFNQSNEFILFNSLKSQNPKQMINNVGFLSHTLKFKGNEDKMGIQYDTKLY